MGSKKTGSWEDHSDNYSLKDIYVFEEILPTLLSKPAKNTIFAMKEHTDMMERFKKSVGGAPLFSEADIGE